MSHVNSLFYKKQMLNLRFQIYPSLGVPWGSLSLLVSLNVEAVSSEEAGTVGVNAPTTFGEQNRLLEHVRSGEVNKNE